MLFLLVGDDMYTSLRTAAQNGHTEVIKLLLASEDIDVNLADIIYLSLR